MKRIYSEVILNHLKSYRQMIFIMGPRQVGKTTLSLAVRKNWKSVYYFNWDNQKDREIILMGPDALMEKIGIEILGNETPVIILDEIHKYSKWKIFLKGLYDSYPNMAHIVVTGSARMEVFNKGGENLMGRYFPYRLHPLSVAEILGARNLETEITKTPKKISDKKFNHLLKFGGFPDPFLKSDLTFVRR